MTTRDKQLKEAQDLLQRTRRIMQSVAKGIDADNWEHVGIILLERCVEIHRFQKRWSKSQKQPQ